ncbi:MAG: AraC family transcriptional regulator [Bifidobacteriaceae bacterium]|jgi:AraC-like DNA-binding protein|nr:AraC family transcriptional regulator [Bifidobacteriaceae bacterium]
MTETIQDGFPGERLRVLPARRAAAASQAPVTRRLLVTDVGYFPQAERHGRSRPTGASGGIVIACTAGRGWCEMGGARRAVGPDQVLVVPPGEPHAYGAEHGDPWTIWWFHAQGTDLGELLQAARLSVNRPVVNLARPERLVSLIDEIALRLEKDDSDASLAAAAGAAWHALALIASDQRAAPSRPDPVALAVEYLQARAGQSVPVRELADAVGLSPSHLTAIFRRSTGYAVVEYQTRLRLARASQYLTVTDLTVKQVATRVGYSDAFYFSRRFRAVYGLSPSAYRASSRR